MDSNTLSDVIVALSAAAYAGSGAAFFVHVSRGGSQRAALAGRIALWVAALLHLAFVLHHSFVFRLCPMKTIHLGISLGMVVAIFLYLLAPKGFRVGALGMFVVPIAATILLASRFFGLPEAPTELRDKLLPLHISSNVLGDGFFVLASGAAAMYLFQEHQLKARRSVMIGRIPPLETLDRTGHHLLLIGFAFLTLGAVTGTVWINKLANGTPLEVARVLLGYGTWALFSAVLLLRSTLGWRGKRAAIGTLAGFVLSMLIVVLYLSGAGAGTR